MKLLFTACVFLTFSGLLANPLSNNGIGLDADNDTTVTALTIEPTDTTPTTALSPKTIEPITSSSEGPTPATLITVSSPNNASTEPTAVSPIITIEPITNSSGGPTQVSLVTVTTPNNVSTGSTGPQSNPTTIKTTQKPPEKETDTGFSGASFGGGIGTGLGICIVLLIAWKCYVMRRQGKGYSTM